jgi:hypothetical protein
VRVHKDGKIESAEEGNTMNQMVIDKPDLDIEAQLNQLAM